MNEIPTEIEDSILESALERYREKREQEKICDSEEHDSEVIECSLCKTRAEARTLGE